MSEAGEYQSVVEVTRPSGTLILPDEFIDGASGVGSVEELSKYFDEHLRDTVNEGVHDADRAKAVNRALELYAHRKETTWNLQKNTDSSSKVGRRYTPDWQSGVENGMKQILVDVMQLEREVGIVDHLYKQAESTPTYINSNLSTPRIAPKA